MTDPLALPPSGAGFRSNVGFIGRWLLLGGAAGALSGFVIGGVGGRLAMFLLRLTSSDSVRGLESDDGFTIGRFSAETIFLLVFTTLLGLIVGIVCIALRSQLPGLRGAVTLVLAGGTLGAAVIVEPDGVDFTRLGPLPLACALFTIIPLAATASTLVAHRPMATLVVDEASTDCDRMRTMDRGRASSYRLRADDPGVAHRGRRSPARTTRAVSGDRPGGMDQELLP